MPLGKERITSKHYVLWESVLGVNFSGPTEAASNAAICYSPGFEEEPSIALGKIAVVQFLDAFQTKCQVALPDIRHKEVGLHK